MDAEREYRGGGRVPLPDWEDSAAGQPTVPAAARENGIRQLRRMSAWSAAALIVGTGAATAAFAHGLTPASQATGSTAAGTTSGTAGPGAAAVHGSSGPTVTHSVATTSASGVTTVTTTRTVGGKTVVTHVQRAPAYRDN
jgi:hypothetical protein